MSIDPPRRRRAAGALHRRTASSVLVLPSGAGEALVLRDDAARAWVLLVEPLDASSIAESLCSTDVGELTCLLDELVALGVLEGCA